MNGKAEMTVCLVLASLLFGCGPDMIGSGPIRGSSPVAAVPRPGQEAAFRDAQEKYWNDAHDWWLDGALPWFQEGSRKGQFGDLAYCRLAHMFRAYDQPDKALETASFAFQRFQNVPCGVQLAGALYETGRLSEARRMLARLEQSEIPGEHKDQFAYLYRLSAKQTWEFDYELNDSPINMPPGSIKKRGYYEFFYRPDMPEQKTKCEVLSAARSELRTDSAGNKILRLWPNGSEPVRLRLTVKLTPTKLTLDDATPLERFPKDVLEYLKPSVLIDPQGPLVQEMAKRLKAPTRSETIRNIRRQMSVIKYDNMNKPGETVRFDSEAVWERKRGYCWDAARAGTALLRACGIPARRVLCLNVYPIGPNDYLLQTAQTGAHVIAEFYDAKNGWLPFQDRPVDVLGSRYIRLASDDLTTKHPKGTPEEVFDWTWYDGGRGNMSYFNVKHRCLEYSILP